jgi:hypothetical protein
MIKPGKYDVPTHILIQGDELDALQAQTYHLAESYGLDRRIERYAGKRPIRLYRWDVEWLIDVLVLVEDDRFKPRRLAERAALASLKTRLKHIYAENYPEFLDP